MCALITTVDKAFLPLFLDKGFYYIGGNYIADFKRLLIKYKYLYTDTFR